MKAEIKQEQQLRLVTESCLNDERAIRHHITGVMRDMRMKCDEMKESLRNLTYVYYFIITCIIISYFSSIFFRRIRYHCYMYYLYQMDLQYLRIYENKFYI